MAEAPAEWTVLSMLEWATSYFDEKGISNSRFSIEWLLASVLDVKRLDLYLIFDRPLVEDELKQLRPLVKRRASHEPLQYITGETDFFNTKIKVRPGVLIPRPETEQLVEIILDDYDHSPRNVLDIGTGSGCIAIALKKNRPDWSITATDISEKALTIAKENAHLNDVSISFQKHNILSPSDELTNHQFDLIVSNPPYILRDERDVLDKEVKEFEPDEALFCTSTQDIYGAIEAFAAKNLSESGELFVEIHEQYGEEVKQIFPEEAWKTHLIEDYGSKDRFLRAKKC